MQISFYSNFSKRINSTKRPASGATNYEGRLKEACSIESPIISFDMGMANAPAYTYAYIPFFSRYYFVNEWTYNDGLWECNLTEDYLASWKTNIGATSAYIDRCASESDGSIIDSQYITKVTPQVADSPLTCEYYYSTGSPNGCYVVGIINGESAYNSQLGGGVTYYVLEDYQLRALVAYLLSTNFLNSAGFPSSQSITQQISQETAKAFVRPFDFITSVVWYPFPVNKFATGNDIQIKVGYWIITTDICVGKLLNTLDASISITGTLGNHPQAQTRGEYLNYSPYTRVMATIPPFGSFPIDISYRVRGNAIRCEVHLDPITGKAELFMHIYDGGAIFRPDDAIVATATAELGVPIQLSQISIDMIGVAQSALQGGGQAITGGVTGFLSGGALGAVYGAVSSAFPSIVNAVTCMPPIVSSKGVDGCPLYIFIRPRLTIEYMLLTDEDNAELGRPLRAIRQISNLTGFIKCYEVTVDYPCYLSEKEKILEYLHNGFFYE